MNFISLSLFPCLTLSISLSFFRSLILLFPSYSLSLSFSFIFIFFLILNFIDLFAIYFSSFIYFTFVICLALCPTVFIYLRSFFALLTVNCDFRIFWKCLAWFYLNRERFPFRFISSVWILHFHSILTFWKEQNKKSKKTKENKEREKLTNVYIYV